MEKNKVEPKYILCIVTNINNLLENKNLKCKEFKKYIIELFTVIFRSLLIISSF